MNTEQLEKGNNLEKEIKELRQHRVNVAMATQPEHDNTSNYRYKYLKMHKSKSGGWDETSLKDEFFNQEDFFLLYLKKLDAKIDKLVKEFEAL